VFLEVEQLVSAAVSSPMQNIANSFVFFLNDPDF
jgi:hypothetical protein